MIYQKGQNLKQEKKINKKQQQLAQQLAKKFIGADKMKDMAKKATS